MVGEKLTETPTFGEGVEPRHLKEQVEVVFQLAQDRGFLGREFSEIALNLFHDLRANGWDIKDIFFVHEILYSRLVDEVLHFMEFNYQHNWDSFLAGIEGYDSTDFPPILT